MDPGSQRATYVFRFSLNQSVHWICHISLYIQEKTKKQGQNDSYENGIGFALAVWLDDSELFPEGLSLKMGRH